MEEKSTDCHDVFTGIRTLFVPIRRSADLFTKIRDFAADIRTVYLDIRRCCVGHAVFTFACVIVCRYAVCKSRNSISADSDETKCMAGGTAGICGRSHDIVQFVFGYCTECLCSSLCISGKCMELDGCVAGIWRCVKGHCAGIS